MTILILGEAWGQEEARERKPFVGASGRLLKAFLYQIGIDYNACYVTNVFNLQPQPRNDITNLCGAKADGIPGMPSLQQGKYVLAEYAPELTRLYHEIKSVKPTLIIALGGTAVWALTGLSGIKKVRGAPIASQLGAPGIKILPTYHPAAVLRDMRLRPVVYSDLQKAKREAEFPEIRRPQREFWLEPTLEDLEVFEQKFILPSTRIGADIETGGPGYSQITCMGFAPSISVAIVVPFVDFRREGNNYWPTRKQELSAWSYIRRWLSMGKTVVGQNFMYDMTNLWVRYGIPSPDLDEDTMLMHHAMQPEMEKSLGLLGTLYTEEPQWKFMRGKGAKKEDE